MRRPAADPRPRVVGGDRPLPESGPSRRPRRTRPCRGAASDHGDAVLVLSPGRSLGRRTLVTGRGVPPRRDPDARDAWRGLAPLMGAPLVRSHVDLDARAGPGRTAHGVDLRGAQPCDLLRGRSIAARSTLAALGGSQREVPVSGRGSPVAVVSRLGAVTRLTCRRRTLRVGSAPSQARWAPFGRSVSGCGIHPGGMKGARRA